MFRFWYSRKTGFWVIALCKFLIKPCVKGSSGSFFTFCDKRSSLFYWYVSILHLSTVAALRCHLTTIKTIVTSNWTCCLSYSSKRQTGHWDRSDSVLNSKTKEVVGHTNLGRVTRHTTALKKWSKTELVFDIDKVVLLHHEVQYPDLEPRKCFGGQYFTIFAHRPICANSNSAWIF